MSIRSRQYLKNQINIVHDPRCPVLNYRYRVYDARRSYNRPRAVSVSAEQHTNVFACKVTGLGEIDLDVSPSRSMAMHRDTDHALKHEPIRSTLRPASH
jgi:hypothetical protein